VLSRHMIVKDDLSLQSAMETPMTVTRRAWQRSALRTDEEFEQHRAVSWLELFFELVFVVMIARLAHHLAGHLDVAGVLIFAVQFLAVFWVWNAFTYYTERFESDGLENRLFGPTGVRFSPGPARRARSSRGRRFPPARPTAAAGASRPSRRRAARRARAAPR